MRIRQSDIAKIANVSQATVSRVLSGDERVEDDIRQRVLVAIEEHNYKPDVRARSLRTLQTHLIGLVVKRPHGALQGDPFYAQLISEILEALASTPYHLCVDMATTESGQVAVYDELLRTRRVDGVLLMESEAQDERIARLQYDDFPFVVLGKADPSSFYSVDNDNVLAGTLATEHLAEQGYSDIAMLAGPEGVTVSEDRIAGYRAVLAERSSRATVVHSEFGYEAARDAARRMLAAPGRPDALVVLDDFMALGAVQAAREHGLRVGADIGIVAFNDSILCGMVEGGLSSVSLHIGALVARATKILLKVIEGKPIEGPRRVEIACELVARGSSRRSEDTGDRW